jgi:hypothetical protein
VLKAETATTSRRVRDATDASDDASGRDLAVVWTSV